MSKTRNHSEALHIFVVGLMPLLLIALLVGASAIVHSDNGAEAADATDGVEIQAAVPDAASDGEFPLFLAAAIVLTALALVGFSAVLRSGMSKTA
jgi:cell division protein FtsL